MWGGRFGKGPAPEAEDFTRSIQIDARLWEQDIAVSLAHIRMLAARGVVSPQEANQIVQGLLDLKRAIETGKVTIDPRVEDIHTFIETKLREKVGPVAGKLHTARSRNDQVVTDLRLWTRDALQDVQLSLHRLQQTLIDLAEEHLQTLMPGLTHQQHAQPVTLAHHLMAYFWMLERDHERLSQSHHRLNLSPLGAGALAGTSIAIDPIITASELQFDDVMPNSMDAVSDRDFVAETLFVYALMMTHLSRLAQELILWSAPEYGFVELDDGYTTGSSLMPQKKNPDVMELIRGRSARAIGNLTAMLTTLKGLTLTYHRDLQDDKTILFETHDFTLPALNLTNSVLSSAVWNIERMRQAVMGDYSTATELANYLVTKGVPFREAHKITGQIVLSCVQQGKPLEALTIEELSAYHKEMGEDVLQALQPDQAVASSLSQTGTAPIVVQAQIELARETLKNHRRLGG